MYQPNPRDPLFVNAYLPMKERNTTQGFHFAFRGIHEF
jgi:hypothetical protein